MEIPDLLVKGERQNYYTRTLPVLELRRCRVRHLGDNQETTIASLKSWDIIATYIAYSIWLARNNLVFKDRRHTAKFILERASTNVVDITIYSYNGIILIAQDIWDSFTAFQVHRPIFVSHEPPFLSFLDIKFDSNMFGVDYGASLVIPGLDGRSGEISDGHLFDTALLEAELEGYVN